MYSVRRRSLCSIECFGLKLNWKYGITLNGFRLFIKLDLEKYYFSNNFNTDERSVYEYESVTVGVFFLSLLLKSFFNSLKSSR